MKKTAYEDTIFVGENLWINIKAKLFFISSKISQSKLAPSVIGSISRCCLLWFVLTTWRKGICILQKVFPDCIVLQICTGLSRLLDSELFPIFSCSLNLYFLTLKSEQSSVWICSPKLALTNPILFWTCMYFYT